MHRRQANAGALPELPEADGVQETSLPSRPGTTLGGSVRIRGARVHNLKSLDVDIPRDRLVVISGPSGSGKSSLAFNTLFAEGQRQYIESLSVYARQFLTQLPRPDVESIDGLPPTICIDQVPTAHGRRSTVGTVTEIYDYLRLLMARCGLPYCFRCDEPICQQSPEQIERHLLGLPEGTRLMIMAPLVRGRKGRHREVLERVRRGGFVRARIDGDVFDMESLPELAAGKVHHIDAVVDRIIVRPGIEKRMAESVRLALKHGDGLLVACYLRPDETELDPPRFGWRDEWFSTLYACPKCGVSYEEIEPRTFSFNSPYGACPVCEGMGTLDQFDPELVIPDWTLRAEEGPVLPWRTASPTRRARWEQDVARYFTGHKLPTDQPWESLDEAHREALLYGDDRQFVGILTMLEREYATCKSVQRQRQLAAFRGDVTCHACQGSRLRPEATCVRLAGQSIRQITRMTLSEAASFFESLPLTDAQREVAEPVIREISKRLAFLQKVGVDYLTLDRAAGTLSGGELQRVRLASGIGSGLVGVCYILDEPSIGLHPRDNQRLIDALRDLQSLGNTVVVVEHDAALIRAADQVIDIGPAAGQQGGRLVAQGTPQELAELDHSPTGRYLSGKSAILLPERRRKTAKTRSLTLEGVTTNNLQDVTVRIPLQALVCVTGVSGSGKSSLIGETLAPALLRRLYGTGLKPGPHRGLRGTNLIDKVVCVDQTPIGRSPRSNPATFTGVFDEIRKVFTGTREAKQLGFRSGRFSFNVKGGRCETCQGHGQRRIEMSFLPDLFVTCESCQGRRFNPQTLRVTYRGQTIADVLEMSVDRATEFFENFVHIERTLQCLQQVGLGYLPLGQSSTTLSGGEAQRVKLAHELARAETGRTLYILDEPTTGLHADDIARLLHVLDQLVDRGNSVVVVEHHLDVMKRSDWIIDLGPEGGAAGGRIVAEGTPEEVAAVDASVTGVWLRPELQGRPVPAADSAD
ncbi:MAG: excinuclease ABC subunit UvrA [Pirellulales bacterium]